MSSRPGGTGLYWTVGTGLCEESLMEHFNVRCISSLSVPEHGILGSFQGFRGERQIWVQLEVRRRLRRFVSAVNVCTGGPDMHHVIKCPHKDTSTEDVTALLEPPPRFHSGDSGAVEVYLSVWTGLLFQLPPLPLFIQTC